MEEPCNEQSSSLAVISQIPGEPAILITGVPPLAQTDPPLPSDPVVDAGANEGTVCLGDWMEGREVKKLFGDKYYSGIVTEFDKEAGWYRVVYEDGDFEDLEGHELHEVLVPLDIAIPLKSLALKVIRKSLKTGPKSRPMGSAPGKRGRPKGSGKKGKIGMMPEVAPPGTEGLGSVIGEQQVPI